MKRQLPLFLLLSDTPGITREVSIFMAVIQESLMTLHAQCKVVHATRTLGQYRLDYKKTISIMNPAYMQKILSS